MNSREKIFLKELYPLCIPLYGEIQLSVRKVRRNPLTNADIAGIIINNEEFRGVLRTIGATGAMDAIQKLVHFGVLTREEIDSFLNSIIDSGERELNFTINGDLCSAHAKLVSANHGKHALLLSINNITQRMNINHQQLMDQSLMNIYSMYLRVSILRPAKDELITVFSRDHHSVPIDEVHSLRTLTAQYAELGVYPGDRDMYLAFIDPEIIQQRIFDSKRGFINGKIRTRDQDGSYTRKMYLAVPTGNREIILLVRYANL